MQAEVRESKNAEIEFFRGTTRLLRKIRFVTLRKLRMSLTIRICTHFCGELIRSSLFFFPLCILVVSLIYLPGNRAAYQRICSVNLTAGSYTQDIIQNENLHAVVTEEEMPAAFFPRAGFFFSHLFQKGHRMQICIPVLQHGDEAKLVFICHDLKPLLNTFLLVFVLLVLSDAWRMCYFLHHHKRLDKTVIQPIRDMTGMAEKVSANNLSNRIDVAGLKNEFQDLAVVINSMLDRIEVSYESQKQFVSDASHELRTPIAVIQGYADMLNRWGKEDPQILQEGIDAISLEAKTMKDLVQDLLFLARHDKKTLMMEMSVFEPLELLMEMKKEAEMVYPQDQFVLEPAEHVQIKADRNMVKQVMRILMDNAIKYTPSGGTITMGIQKGSHGAILTMQDTGDGIAPEDLPHIFDRFYRADKARKAESGGHGLGLSIARIIVVAHGGKIRVRSKVGEGSVFMVELPFEAGESGETAVVMDNKVQKPRRFTLRRHTGRKRKDQ